MYPKYAKGFQIFNTGNEVKLICRDPKDTTVIYATLAFDKNQLPLNKICITSTTHAFIFDALNTNQSIIGMSGLSYLLDSNLKRIYTNNHVAEIGKDDNLNREKIIALEPRALMVYPYPGANFSAYEKAGVTVVYNGEYLEEHPLGKAEWIKIAGLLTGKEKEALAYFNALEQKYKTVMQHVPKTNKTPNVLLGRPIENTWHIPGNKSFAAQLIHDAGANYCFANENTNNTVQKTCEWVLENTASTTHWIFTDYVSGEITPQLLNNQNKVFKHLSPFKTGNVYVCNAATCDFFGKAVIEPHVLLQDIVNCLYSNDTKNNVYFHKI